MSHPSRRPFSMLLAGFLGLALAVGGCQTSKPASEATVSDEASGSGVVAIAAEPVNTGETAASQSSNIRPGPTSIRSFAPAEEKTTTLGAANLSARDLFETMGPEATTWFMHVLSLANPYMEGRAPDTQGSELAAQYMEWHMKRAKLEPAFPETATLTDEATAESLAAPWVSYRQPFEFSMRGQQRMKAEGRATIGEVELIEGTDFVVLGNAGTGEFTGPVTFVGYAIEEGEDNYTSFDDTSDLTGRVAVIFRYEPLNDEGKSQWSLDRFSAQAAMNRKFAALSKRKAAAVIVVSPPGSVDAEKGFVALERSALFSRDNSVPVVQFSEEAAERLFAADSNEPTDLMSWRKRADSGEVKTVNLIDDVKVTIATKVTEDKIKASNVGGVLRGRGSLANEWIIIGAHRDHIGHGYTGMRDRRNRNVIHPGADDNASGTAGLLVLIDRLAATYANAPEDTSLRSILFIGFDAEEAGLHGSVHYVKYMTVAKDSVNLMLNMDMIGRLRNDELSVSGTGTAIGFNDMLKPIFESSGLKISTTETGSGPSDHASFFNGGMPVLFPFTGLHDDYHTPGDKAYTVNPVGAIKVLDLVEDLAMEFATRSEKLQFSRPAPGRGSDRGYGPVRLGIRPSMSDEPGGGVKVDEVSDGTSAADAGIRAGDVLLSWNGVELEDTRTMFTQLQNHQPGDRVKIMLRRGEDVIPVDVILRSSGRTAAE